MQSTSQNPGVAADLALAYPPANHYERTLLNNAVSALERLLRAYDLERQVLEKHDLFHLFTEKPETFKNLARHIAECDRIYRRSIEALERAHRARAKSAKAAQSAKSDEFAETAHPQLSAQPPRADNPANPPSPPPPNSRQPLARAGYTTVNQPPLATRYSPLAARH